MFCILLVEFVVAAIDSRGKHTYTHRARLVDASFLKVNKGTRRQMTRRDWKLSLNLELLFK